MDPNNPGQNADGGQPSAGAEHPVTVNAPWTGVEGVYKIGEGETAKPWWDGIKEEPVRQYMEEKQYANPEQVAMAAWNANKINKLAPNVTAVLEGKATPEQEAAFYNTFRPESAEKYDLKTAEGAEVDPALMGFAKELAFDLGLTPKRAQTLVDKWQSFQEKFGAQSVEAKRQANDQELATLTQTWGADLEANKAAGARVMRDLKLDPASMAKIEANIGSAAVVDLLARIGRASAEGGLKGGNNNNGDPNDPNNMTSEQAQAKIDQLNTDVDFQKRYTNKSEPGHKEAVQQMVNLFARATPTKK